jgi:peptidoglycan/xylan/chitin deacetylase (PgdA/CDA1 family)
MVSLLAGTGIALGAAAGGYFAPHALRFLHAAALQRLCRRTGSVVLTYDDGPGANATPAVLDVLARHGAKATFFLLGMRVGERPDLVDRIVHERHEVGCHGHAHVSSWRAPPWRVMQDVERGYTALAPWINREAPFRPPFGRLTAATWLAVRRRGSPIALWTLDTRDASERPMRPKDAAEALVRARGGVVLMHDYEGSAARTRATVETTEELLAAARANGLVPRSLRELLGAARPRSPAGGAA